MVPFIEEVSSEENKKVSLAWQILLALVLVSFWAVICITTLKVAIG
ncbi:glutamate-aspartate carrier protein [Klebsiella pneumoniae]|uniref:Glutamate-aspartate carrier protein n=1 Tax=Klebsiella pneumoniae TaxID=573 RepID=A0A377XJ63_KLEPN|nr:glutamate-aspartate carrier protein [Klebsiella pneumoniae]